MIFAENDLFECSNNIIPITCHLSGDPVDSFFIMVLRLRAFAAVHPVLYGKINISVILAPFKKIQLLCMDNGWTT